MSSLGLERIPDEGTAEPERGSTLAKIRALYQQAKGERHLDLPLPGALGRYLQVRYGVIDTDDLTDTAKTVREFQQDVLIAACQCMLIRSDAGEYGPLLYDGQVVCFDEMLSELAGLGVPPVEQGGTARAVVVAAFRGAPSPYMAITDHVSELERWMAGKGQVNEESLLGES